MASDPNEPALPPDEGEPGDPAEETGANEPVGDAPAPQEAAEPPASTPSEPAEPAPDAVAEPEASAPPEPAGEADASGEMDQANIDALFGDSAGAAPDPVEAAASGEIDQADIDALFGDSVGGAPNPAEAGAPGDAKEAEGEPKLDTLGRPFDEHAAAMLAAMEEDAAAAPPPATSEGEAFEFEPLEGNTDYGFDTSRVSMLSDVNLPVRIELGRTNMLVEEVLGLEDGSIVSLDKLAGDPVDVFVNDRLIARGEVIVLNDSFCVRVSEVITNDPHRIAT